MIHNLVVLVTAILGPIAAIVLICSLLLSQRLQHASFIERCVLSCAAAGLLFQLAVFLEPSLYAEWWVFKDIALILMAVNLICILLRGKVVCIIRRIRENSP